MKTHGLMCIVLISSSFTVPDEVLEIVNDWH